MRPDITSGRITFFAREVKDVTNVELAGVFSWFRDRIGANRKGTRTLQLIIETCPVNIYNYFSQHRSLKDLHIGDNIGKETRNILELILESEKKEDALKEYFHLRRKCSHF